MNEHALDAMIYAWMVMKEKEESSMEGIFLGQAVDGVFSINKTTLTFDHECDIHELHPVIRYSDCDYMLVKADDVIKTNDELLKLREENKKLKDQKKRLSDECIYWNNRFTSVMTDLGKVLSANGVEFSVKEIDGDGNWNVVIDIPELNEAKDKIIELEQKVRDERKWCDYWRHTYYAAEKVASVVGVSIKIDGIESQHNSAKVIVQNDKAEELKKQVVQMEDLEKKLKAAKSNETYWRDRKEEEEDYHHYWLHTFDRAVKRAEQKGVYIGVSGNDEDCNAGVVVVDNVKAEELKSQVVQLKKENEELNKKVEDLRKENSEFESLLKRSVGLTVNSTELTLKAALTVDKTSKKWSAMTEALKEKGVEVIYMGEEDGKPLIDVKIPGWEAERAELKEQCDIIRKDGVLKGQQCLKLTEDLNTLKKEHDRVLGEFALCIKQAECNHKKLEELKSRTLDNVEIRLSCGDIVWTYCDGFVHVSSGIINTDEISTGTIPKCSSCAHYMYNPSRFTHDWCYMPVPKEGGAGYIRKLNKEEAEGPACSDFKAKE